MRISEKEAECISRLARSSFGQGSEIKLFGSRVDDSKLGGDIDLLIVVSEAELAVARSNKFRFLDRLQGEIGEQRIDVVITTNERIAGDEFLQSLDLVEL